ncbi:MAG: dTDP-4-dehydrorhamnose 3,5-epimerase family protein [Proteobacteria bacterium]|nr:dTDP-4-dehydrorhamnose 3,5-epimerase family protein [Pseudomonadota bacterium]
MIFTSTTIAGAWVVELDRKVDERGYFARVWCAEEFQAHGLPPVLRQGSVSQNARAGTLRGMHFQWPPSAEGKLVRCEAGSVHDVIVDLRPESATFQQHLAFDLEAAAGKALYIPPGCAHGFQTLQDDSRVLYLMTDVYAPELADGVRYDDPAFGIRWPLPVSMIAARDASYPDFDVVTHRGRFGRGGHGTGP